ncbi:MAG TPA: TetR/AcrR family transcriptional regulator [Acidimicrobiales bacterium]|jgi:AcrR family transcriptional regulator
MPSLTAGIETPAAPTTPESDLLPAQLTDGRTRRRLNSYERAVDALLDLIESGNEAPTAQQIAERSGISVRTVFRLTEDIESLHAAGVLRQMERTAHLYGALPGTGALTARLRTLVQHRVSVFETIAPVRRVGERLAANSTRIAEGLELHHMVLRTQVAEVFERELHRLPRPRRVTALDAIDVAAGWETWEQLRRGKGLSVTAAARVMELLIAGALRG